MLIVAMQSGDWVTVGQNEVMWAAENNYQETFYIIVLGIEV